MDKPIIENSAPDTSDKPDTPAKTETPPVLQPPTPKASRQLSLFQSFCGPPAQTGRWSNVIDIWDAAPKYATPCRQAAMSDPPTTFMERTFRYQDQVLRVAVAPAVLRGPDGAAYYRLPTAREELIEEALRKIAVQQQSGFVASREDRPIFGVRFTLAALRRELARHGHAVRYPALIESLLTLSGSVVEIGHVGRRTAMHRSTILSDLSAVSRDDFLRDPQAIWSAHFHPMVTGSLAAMAYRQYDYELTMSYHASLARWLHKYLAAVYVNAGLLHPHPVLLSTIATTSGLLSHARLRDRAREFETVLSVLMGSSPPVLRTFERNPVFEGRATVDVHYLLHPTPAFVQHVVLANRRQRDGRELDRSPAENRDE